MRQSIVILDDVIPAIDRFREIALQQEFPPARAGVKYPGRNSARPMEIKGLHQQIEQVLGEPLLPMRSDSHNHFRLALDGEDKAASVHIDPCHWTGILYLNPPHQCRGGTDFYRHKATGLENVPNTEDQIRQSGHSTYEDFIRKEVDANTNNPDAWEHIMHVPMRYNRLVLFRPWYFHDAGQSFGNDVSTGRLIYMMFFFSKAELGTHSSQIDSMTSSQLMHA